MEKAALPDKESVNQVFTPQGLIVVFNCTQLYTAPLRERGREKLKERG